MLSPVALECDHVPDLHHARAKLRSGHYPVVLTEAGLPDGSWLDVLSMVRGITPGAEVIVTDRDADARFWAEVLNLGGYDMLAQPFHESEVRRILSNACSRSQVRGAGHRAL
ncbi:MAG: hypothetical protein U0Q18_08045 [Bryobacteraceae bacterium]